MSNGREPTNVYDSPNHGANIVKKGFLDYGTRCAELNNWKPSQWKTEGFSELWLKTFPRPSIDDQTELNRRKHCTNHTPEQGSTKKARTGSHRSTSEEPSTTQDKRITDKTSKNMTESALLTEEEAVKQFEGPTSTFTRGAAERVATKIQYRYRKISPPQIDVVYAMLLHCRKIGTGFDDAFSCEQFIEYDRRTPREKPAQGEEVKKNPPLWVFLEEARMLQWRNKMIGERIQRLKQGDCSPWDLP